MPEQMICAGLPASWLNAWLAAVGTTVLDPRIRLHWTAGSNPLAVLSAEGVDPLAAVVESWPNAGLLIDLPIAKNWRETVRFPRNIPVGEFKERVRSARGHRHSWSLSSTITDLCVDEHGEVDHAPFDPPAPQGVTLHDRLTKVHSAIEPTIKRIADSLSGRAPRIQANGLGFDIARLGSQADEAKPFVDPVIETLAFFGLKILPVRSGVDQRVRQRGWLRIRGDKSDRRFMWPAWNQPLDCAGIDALMDVWKPDRKRDWSRIGISAGWRCVPRISRGSNDVKRAFGSEPL